MSIILIAEDDDTLRASLTRSFTRRGHEVLAAGSVSKARELLASRTIDLLLADIKLADGTGIDIISAAREADSEIQAIVITAFPEIRTAVTAMQAGAVDYISKPFELEELHHAVSRALEHRELRRTVARLTRQQGLSDRAMKEILGTSPAIEAVREQIRMVATAATPVLIVGETGTGKELIADSIHRLSPRSEGPLIKVNCSAIPEQLLESELFGHEKGAFTDAREARHGLFEMADGGTLFLDEVSEMRLGLQAKLLRVVEGHAFSRVGGQRQITTDVRILAATNRNLPDRIRTGDFREDLFYRLNVFEITAPPLRVRAGDVKLLASEFLARAETSIGKERLTLDDEAVSTLTAYYWPGNVRELRNVMERAAILCQGSVVRTEHLPSQLMAAAFVRRTTEATAGDVLPKLAEVEQQYMAYVLEHVGGNLSAAARELGIARNTLKAKLRASGAAQYEADTDAAAD